MGASSPEELRPDACVIGYGAWDNSGIQHDPVFYNPHAARIAQDCTPELDIINYVDEHTAPLFIWHNLHDRYVPACNPLLVGSRMYELGRPFELHLFNGGARGMSVANDLSCYGGEHRVECEENPNVSMWVPLCVNWLNGLFGIDSLRAS